MWAPLVLLLCAGLLAWVIQRRVDRAYRPVAIYLTGWLLGDLVRLLLATLVLAPWKIAHGNVPLTGGARLAGHLEQGLLLGSWFGIAALAGWFFTRAPLLAGVLYTAALVACVHGYPELRGEALGSFYRILTVVAVGLALLAIARKRLPVGLAHLVVLLLVAGLTATLAGPFLGSPFKDWSLAQLTWTVFVGLIVLVQGGWLLWRFRTVVAS